MSRRQILTLLVIAVVLLLQFGVPAMQLLADGSNRWGWQMYSRAPQVPRVLAVRSDGTVQSLQLNTYVHQFRYELRYDGPFVDQLCARVSGAAEFQIEDQLSGETVTFECSE